MLLHKGANADTLKATRPQSIASYTLSVRLDPSSHRVFGSGTIRFTNASGVALNELWFHLYANAFSHQRTRFLRKAADFRRSNRAELFKSGSLEILRLSKGDSEATDLWSRADPTTPGDPDDSTDRRVPLSEPLLPGCTLELNVKFVTELPFIVERMGWIEDFYAVAQWFPKLARLEADGTWRHFPYEPLAEFSADFGNYDLTIDAPGGFIVAAPGERKVLRQDDDRIVTRFRLDNAHDFAWFAWNQFVLSERDIAGVQVRVYAPPGHAKNVEEELTILTWGLKHFQMQFGPYPYTQLIVVHPPDVAASAGGMEYPGLIVTGGPWYLPWSGLRSIAAVTLHELAHQWFYGLIASDEARYPVLDEGLSTWAELDGLSSLFGPGSAFSGLGVTVSASAVAAGAATSRYEKGALARPASDFHTFSTLAATVYARTATLLNTLSNVYGKAKLQRALYRYATTERYSHPTPDSLITAVEAEMGPASAKNLKTALYSDGWVDYAAIQLSSRRVSADHWISTVLLLRRGTLDFPVQVALTLQTGQVMYRSWEGGKVEFNLELSALAPVDHVTVDPENKIEIESDRLNNATWRTEPAKPLALLDRLAYLVAWLLGAVIP